MAEGKYGRLFTEREVHRLMRLAYSDGLNRNGTDAQSLPWTPAFAIERFERVQDPLTFPADEPLFLLRGQDAAAVPAVRDYGLRADAAGARAVHLGAVSVAALEMENWQRANPDRVKVPD